MDDGSRADLRTARAPRRRSRRRPVFVIAIVIAVFSACEQDPCDGGTCIEGSGARALDRICAQYLTEGPACEVSGAAQQTSGITADTIGYRLGDGGGMLTIHLQAVEAALSTTGIFEIEVLAAARDPGAESPLTSTFTWGSCGQCPQDPPAYTVPILGEYTWITVVNDQATTTEAIQYDATLTLSGADIDIADVRTTSVYPAGCSIAGPVGGRP